MALVQRPTTDGSIQLGNQNRFGNALIRSEVPRTSELQAPIMLLSGHEGDVHTVRFNSTGEHLASGSFDRTISIWNVFGECKNWAVLKGHGNAVLDLQWSRDNSMIFSASADRTVGIWDVSTGTRVRKQKGHTSIVSCLTKTRRGTEFIATGSDDTTAKVWDPRVKNAVDSLDTALPVTAIEFSETGNLLFTASVDNVVKAWDMRSKSVVFSLNGHLDTIVGARLSPDGTALLTNSVDNTVRIWDVKPFSSIPNRCSAILEGAPHDFSQDLIRPCWSPKGKFVACGAGDRSVVVWDAFHRKILYKLPGHKGTVTDVDWHPSQPILASGSTDRNIFLGELDVKE